MTSIVQNKYQMYKGNGMLTQRKKVCSRPFQQETGLYSKPLHHENVYFEQDLLYMKIGRKITPIILLIPISYIIYALFNRVSKNI